MRRIYLTGNLNDLKNDVGFSDSAATQVLSVYRDNLVYFPDTTSAKLHDPEAVVKEQEKNDDHTRKDKPVVNIGDWVQWAPNGVLKFANAKRVTWIDETADFVRVGGSMSALPLDEIELAERPKADAATEPTSGQWDVLLSGNRLQITADVDSAGLKKLKQVLDKYEFDVGNQVHSGDVYLNHLDNRRSHHGYFGHRQNRTPTPQAPSK